jgi:D-lyxose ketol-isomerase
MSIQAKNFKSNDGKLVLKLIWEDVDMWIEASETINLDPGEGAKLYPKLRTYLYGDDDWATIRQEFGLNTTDQYDTSVISVYQTFSDIDNDHSVDLPLDEFHSLVKVPHTVCLELVAPDGSKVSKVTGEAL